MKKFSKPKLIIALLFILGLSLRLFGINWDQGNHLHPDERFLTMVSNDILLPSSISQYFNNATSPLNPYNYPQYQFFVYGTFPIFLTKFIAVLIGLNNYDKIYLIGRFLSALFDSFNILLLYFISLKIFKPGPNSYLFYLSSFLYAFCVLPIQLSHFYAVDTFLNFFITATFTGLVYGQFLFAGVAFGLALASKISAVYFLPIVFIFFIRFMVTQKKYLHIILSGLVFLFFCSILFRVFQPYSFDGYFSFNSKFIDNLKQLQSMTRPDGNFPPSIQWFSKKPLLYSLQNIVLWGIGLPLSILSILGLLKINIKKTNFLILISISWIIFLYFYQGSQFAHTMRYFIPIYPFIVLITVYLTQFINKIIFNFLVICHVIFGFLFLSIYTRPHTRVQASYSIYDQIPIGSKITNEYWDDPLPLYLPGKDPYIYSGSMLSLYDPDTTEKWQKLDPIINNTNYIIMSSNRLWGSIPLVPDKYPKTSTFYNDLFLEKLNFTKLVEINSYPGIGLSFLKKCYYFGPTNFPVQKNYWFSIDANCQYPGIYIRDDIAEEAFTVYDHPKVLIFSRK